MSVRSASATSPGVSGSNSVASAWAMSGVLPRRAGGVARDAAGLDRDEATFGLDFAGLATFAAFLFSAACSAAYADQPVAGPALPPSHIALGIAPAKVRAPYDVQIMRENG